MTDDHSYHAAPSRHEVRAAMSRVMMLWLVSLVISGGAVGTAIFLSAISEPPIMPERPIDLGLIIVALIFVIGTVVPPAIHWRMMHTYWRDGVVQPRGYWRAYIVLYAGYTATAVILSVFAMLRPGAWGFEVMAAIPPMILLLLAWPTGDPMVHRRTREQEDDSEILHMPEEDEDD